MKRTYRSCASTYTPKYASNTAEIVHLPPPECWCMPESAVISSNYAAVSFVPQ